MLTEVAEALRMAGELREVAEEERMLVRTTQPPAS